MDTFLKPIEHFMDYKLRPGDRITILKGSGAIQQEPDWVEVIQELPQMILVRFCYKHWRDGVVSYRRCLNKVHMISGDISWQKEEKI